MIFLVQLGFARPTTLDTRISFSKAAEQTLRVEGSLHGEVTYFFSSVNMAVQHFLIYTGED